MNRSPIAAGVPAAPGSGGVVGVPVFSPRASDAQSSSTPGTTANDGWHSVELTSAAGMVEVRVDATAGVETIDLHRNDGNGGGSERGGNFER